MKMLFTLSLLAFLIALGAGEVTQTPNAIIIQNKNYTARVVADKGNALDFVLRNKTKTNITNDLQIHLNRESKTYIQDSYGERPLILSAPNKNVVMKVLESTEKRIRVSVSWDFDGGNVVHEFIFDDTPVITSSATVNFTKRLDSVVFRAFSEAEMDQMTFFPDGKRIPGVPGFPSWLVPQQGAATEGAAWRYAWDSRTGTGFGLMALPDPRCAGLEYCTYGKSEKLPNLTIMRIVYHPLAELGTNGSVAFNYKIFAGGDPQTAQLAADGIFGKQTEPLIQSVEFAKVVTRPGVPNHISAVIANPTTKTYNLKLKNTLVSGLDTETKLPEQSFTLNPGERKNVEFDVVFPSDVRWGVTLYMDLKDENGKILSSKREYSTVTDFVPAAAAFGILYSNWVENTEGFGPVWNSIFKSRYVGAYEYYCWAPSTIGGLAPKRDEWEPHSEGQSSYSYVRRYTLTKKGVKDLVNDAHSKGMGVYTWMTGLFNYEYAYAKPELIQYTKNGQPCVYTSVIKGDKRFAVVKPNMFTPERAAAWGNEMADSVDMFGWDGCRWDWTFRRNSANDPIWSGQDMKDGWYDQNGVSAEELYPDSDKVGYEALRAFRDAVTKRHPNFDCAQNLTITPEMTKKYPKFNREMARQNLVLVEEMLGIHTPKYNTFRKWGEQLAERREYLRISGGQPVVGSMWDFYPGGVSNQLAHYTAYAAGVKWWELPVCQVKGRDRERNAFMLRFAEYYFDDAFRKADESLVSMNSSERVLFKPFLRERTKNGLREIVVPMVNLPDKSDYICQYQAPPQVRKNLVFKCDGNPVAAWLMSPQGSGRAIRLPVKDGRTTVPELRDGAILLFQFKGE